MPNVDEIEYWNAEAGSRWAELQERIDRAFAPLGAAGLAAGAPQPGAAILDIGCGTGATSLALAAAAAPNGRVLCVDVSRPMLGLAQERAAKQQLTNMEFLLADASVHVFDASAFDLAFSRFGVMFFDDAAGAFANVRRALRPGARLAFVCWRSLGENPWFHVPIDALRPFAPPQPKTVPDAPGPLSFADPDRVRTILAKAGYSDVKLDLFDADLPFGAPAAAAEFVSKVGPAGRLLGLVPDRARADALGALDAALHPHIIDGEVQLRAGVWIVTARVV